MTEDKFFDRRNYLELLEKRINHLKDGYRQNIAIVGDELVGKSSIIFELLNRFCDNRIIMIYLETRQETLASFARRFIGTLLYNFLVNSGIPLQEDLHFLILKSARFIPKTAEEIERILASLDKRKRSNVFTALLSLCQTLHEETGKSCVVIFDEFQNLEGLGAGSIYLEWSRLLITQKNTLYIIISSAKFKTANILSKKLSLLFGNFEVVNIEPFDIKTSEEYIERRLRGLSLDTGLKNFIVHFTGGFPLYLEVITEALLKSRQERLSDILENLLFDTSGSLNQRFSNYLRRFMDNPYGNDYLLMLHLIASGRNKAREIAHIMKKSQKELASRINYLLEADAIAKNGDFLKINDRVFSFWLMFVHQEKLQSLTFDAQSQKQKFRDKIEGMIDDFLMNASKPVTQRLSELLRLFEDDVLQLDRKRIRLNHFREIKQLELSGRIKEGVIGRSTDSVWIMAFKRDLLTEEDIVDFSKECKKFRHKLQRRIIVTFSDMDTNARLRALEEKIWAWDINNLNQLFDIFSKPRVIA